MKSQERGADVLDRLTAALVADGAFSQTLCLVAQELVEYFRLDLLRIWLCDATSGLLVLGADAGPACRRAAPLSLLESAVMERRKFACRHPTRCCLPSASFEHGTYAGYPLICSHRIAGIIEISKEQPLGEESLKLLDSISRVVALYVLQHQARENPVDHEPLAFCENSVVGLHCLSAEGVIVRANQAEMSMLGYEADEYTGKRISELHADQDVAENLCRKLVMREPVRNLRAKLVAKDGSIRHVIIDCDAVYIDGSFAYTRCFTRDVTDSAIARDHLERARQLFRAVFDQTFQFIGVLSLDGILIDANQTALNLIGAKLEDVLGQYFWDTPWWSYSRVAREKLKEAVAGAARGETHRFEAEHIDYAGNIIHVDFSLKPVLDDFGNVVLLIPEGRDITERKRAEKEIMEKEARTRAIVDCCEDAIYGTDQELIITSWNPAAQLLYGYSAEEAIGCNLSVMVPPDRLAESDKLLDAVRSGGKAQNVETVRLSKDGRILDVALTVSPIRDSQQQLTGLSIISRDISLKKAAEKRVSEFYSMVSHELRTPLTSIRASLGLLEAGLAGNLSSEAVQLVQIALSESDRLIRLINDILDLRKIEAGKLELRLECVHAQELIQRLVAGMRAVAEEAEVTIDWTVEQPAELQCDRDRVIQVLTNLCSNAIKYSPAGERITINVGPGSPGFIRFSVCDRGPGITAENMHKLFGKFQQIDSSDSRPKGGTGLGLAIVKAIVEQHAGHVGVESRPAKGSVFWFELPCSS